MAITLTVDMKPSELYYWQNFQLRICFTERASYSCQLRQSTKLMITSDISLSMFMETKHLEVFFEPNCGNCRSCTSSPLSLIYEQQKISFLNRMAASFCFSLNKVSFKKKKNINIIPPLLVLLTYEIVCKSNMRVKKCFYLITAYVQSNGNLCFF